jgi:hypothetical protein
MALSIANVTVTHSEPREKSEGGRKEQRDVYLCRGESGPEEELV